MVCTNLQTDPSNCKTCGNICPGSADGTATCTAGVCGLTCSMGYHLCTSQCLSNSSVSSCGASCSACGSVVNGTAGCSGTACEIASCLTGYANCDGVFADGCNVDTQTDPANCGGCTKACSLPNATAGCASSACTIASCNASYMDCNMMASDGCEVDIKSDNGNCGGCGIKCTGGETCSGGICACGSGTTLCNSTCTNTMTDNNNCGGCGQVCTATTCASGLCTPVVLASGTNVDAPYDITTDGTDVYWTNYVSAGSVGKVADTGGTSVLIATGQAFPQDIAYYGGKIYFTIENAGNGAELLSVTTAGASLATLDSATNWAKLGAGSNFADGIASDKGGNIYWASNGGGSYLILKWSTSTSSDSIVSNSANGLLGGIAADSTGIVYTQPTLSRVIIPPNNSIDTGDSNPGRVTNAGGVFYYIIQGTGGNGQIHSYADSASSFNYVAMNLNHPAYLASDGVSVYWSDENDNAIYRTPVAGGPIFTLAKMTGVSALTVDSTYVYFVTTTEVLRVPK
jgi:hypothetical protein